MGKLLQFNRKTEKTSPEKNYRERIREINASLDRVQAIMQEIRDARANILTHSKR